MASQPPPSSPEVRPPRARAQPLTVEELTTQCRWGQPLLLGRVRPGRRLKIATRRCRRRRWASTPTPSFEPRRRRQGPSALARRRLLPSARRVGRGPSPRAPCLRRRLLTLGPRRPIQGRRRRPGTSPAGAPRRRGRQAHRSRSLWRACKRRAGREAGLTHGRRRAPAGRRRFGARREQVAAASLGAVPPVGRAPVAGLTKEPPARRVPAQKGRVASVPGGLPWSRSARPARNSRLTSRGPMTPSAPRRHGARTAPTRRGQARRRRLPTVTRRQSAWTTGSAAPRASRFARTSARARFARITQMVKTMIRFTWARRPGQRCRLVGMRSVVLVVVLGRTTRRESRSVCVAWLFRWCQTGFGQSLSLGRKSARSAAMIFF